MYVDLENVVLCLYLADSLYDVAPCDQMVVYEAARAMVNLNNVTARELQPAVSGTIIAHKKTFTVDHLIFVYAFSSADVFDFCQANCSFCSC